MKTICIIRHAKASKDLEFMDDMDRPLSSKGYVEAYKTAFSLASKKIIPHLIISSPACRAYTFAVIIARAFNYPADKILLNKNMYPGDENIIADELKQTDNKIGNLFLIGHNPSLTFLVNLLSENKIDHLLTGSVVCIKINSEKWKDAGIKMGTTEFFIDPDLTEL